MYITPHICVDDYGDAVYRCHYTEKIIWIDDVLWVGAHVPGVNASYPMANNEYAKELRKQTGIIFQENDANCNTCYYLKRVKHPKCSYGSGFLEGICENPTQLYLHPYKTEGDRIKFHPDDWMGMPCYVSRWSKINAQGTLNETIIKLD